MSTTYTAGRFQAFDANGDPLSGGKLFTYLAGTTTPQATYTSASLATPNANPVILDSSGRAQVWLTAGAAYRMVLKTSADVTVTDDDNIEPDTTDGALVTYMQSGAGAVVRTAQAKMRERISLGDYGLPTGGDDSPLIQQLVNEHPGALIVAGGAGPFVFNSTVIITADDTEVDMEQATVDCTALTGAAVSGQPYGAFKITGSLRGTTTMTASAAIYATSITVASVANIQIGDIIHLESSSQVWYTETASPVMVQTINRVRAISGLTLSLAYALPLPFSTSGHTVTVESWNAIKNTRIRGGRWYGGGVRASLLNGAGPAVLYATYFDGCELLPTYVEGFQGFVARFQYGMAGTYCGGVMRGLADDYSTAITENVNSGFYGVGFYKVRGWSMQDVVSYRNRHTQDAAEGSDGTVSNVKSYDSHRPGLGSHQGETDTIYSYCIVNGTKGGLQWRGFNLTVDSCRIFCPALGSSGIYDATDGATGFRRKYIFSNNEIVAERHALNLNGNYSSCVLDANTLRGGIFTGYPVLLLESAISGLTTITDNDISCIDGANTVAVDFANNTPTTRTALVVKGGRISNYTGTAVRMYAAASGSSMICQGILLEPVSGTNHILPVGAMNHVATGPNYIAGGSTVFGIDAVSSTAFVETLTTPDVPGASAQGNQYIKGDKLVIQFNDAGTARYKYLDLTGTGVTWVHTTVAP